MDHSLFSSRGNLIDSFLAEVTVAWVSDETEARAALQRIVEAEPDAADDVALFIAGRKPMVEPRDAGVYSRAGRARSCSPHRTSLDCRCRRWGRRWPVAFR